jgi:hypothetical protein
VLVVESMQLESMRGQGRGRGLTHRGVETGLPDSC